MLMFAHITIFALCVRACWISVRTLDKILMMKSTYHPSGSEGLFVKYADHKRSGHLYKSSVADAVFVFILALTTTTANVVMMLNIESFSTSDIITALAAITSFAVIAVFYAANTNREYRNAAFHFHNEHRREVDHRLAAKEKSVRAKHSDSLSYKDSVKIVEDSNDVVMATTAAVPLWGSADSLNDK